MKLRVKEVVSGFLRYAVSIAFIILIGNGLVRGLNFIKDQFNISVGTSEISTNSTSLYAGRSVFIVLLLLLFVASLIMLSVSIFVLISVFFMPKQWKLETLARVDNIQPNDSSYDVIGYRFAKLVQDTEGNLTFKSVTNPTEFKTTARAACTNQGSHEAPDKDCTCGWYSCQTAVLLNEVYMPPVNLVLLQCHYAGKIIPGEIGHRAEVQHVLKAYFPKICMHGRCRQSTIGVFIDGLVGDLVFDTKANVCAGSYCEKHSRNISIIGFSLTELKNQLGCDFEYV